VTYIALFGSMEMRVNRDQKKFLIAHQEIIVFKYKRTRCVCAWIQIILRQGMVKHRLYKILVNANLLFSYVFILGLQSSIEQR